MAERSRITFVDGKTEEVDGTPEEVAERLSPSSRATSGFNLLESGDKQLVVNRDHVVRIERASSREPGSL